MRKRIGSFVVWLAVLFAGLFLISNLTWNMAMAGAGTGTGVFSYHFSARFNLSPDSPDDFPVGSVNVEGDADRRFALWGQYSPEYQQVKIDWRLLLAQESDEGQAVADLDEMQLHHENEIQPLNLKSLSTLLGVGDEPESNVVAELYAFLESARDGTLPVPSHHSYSFSDPLRGTMQHFASDPFIRPVELAWVIAWCGFGVTALIKRSSSRMPKEA